MSEFAVLRLVAVKGRVSAPAAAECLGLAPGIVESILAGFVRDGLATQTPAGVRILGPGRERVAELVAAERARTDRAGIDAVYDEFCALNAELKEIVTAWQLRDGDTPNDHTDARYDAGVVERLGGLHRRAAPVVRRIGDLAPRLAPYGHRLDAADGRIAAGDHQYVARPIVDSYHTVWFELHEDLIGLAGRSRTAEATAGRGA